ncbi:MAG TPA: addiction module protein, partial [Chromatiaceae bacterium]|nr:addiction module protein [Chromatiaceae bacterium]
MTDELMHSFARPALESERIWLEEAERRLAAHRTGQVKGIPQRKLFLGSCEAPGGVCGVTSEKCSRAGGT